MTNAELAEKYGIHRHTVAKWRKSTSIEDASSRPKHLCTTLDETQEEVVVTLRKMLLLPLDDLLVVVKKFIESKLSRSALHRCLVRHGVSNLKALKKRWRAKRVPRSLTSPSRTMSQALCMWM